MSQAAKEEANTNLIALMHNSLPALLEAVEALEAIVAREQGIYDLPALVKYGELRRISHDVLRIATSALDKLK
jgi:hypothetical protein